ncbi:MAG: helix-turn-helix domain-containing protein [Phycisphaerales bacterium]|jgi:hypothetical protein|nr:helix-turn-helix domain-containing protein [Phycisphaerales bacterium]
MLALLQWRDKYTNEVYPSVKTIAAALGVSESTARSYLRRAEECGALEVIGSRSGGRRSTRYRMNFSDPLANPPDSNGFNPPDSGPQPTEIRRPTHRNSSPNPPDSGPEPSRNHPMNQQPQPEVVDDVFSLFWIENLLGHPNATHERLAYIKRYAPNAENPSAWAAKCIREGWKVPPPPAAELSARARAERDRRFDEFESLSKADQLHVLYEVKQRFPNLTPLVDRYRAGAAGLDDLGGLRGAIASVMEAREKIAAETRAPGIGAQVSNQ